MAPASYKETDEYKWFQKNFANETFVLISWDGCTLQDERLKILVRQADARPARCRMQGPRLFSHLITGPGAVDQMTGPPMNLSEPEATSGCAAR